MEWQAADAPAAAARPHVPPDPAAFVPSGVFRFISNSDKSYKINFIETRFALCYSK
jgi:hypothetical protein